MTFFLCRPSMLYFEASTMHLLNWCVTLKEIKSWKLGCQPVHSSIFLDWWIEEARKMIIFWNITINAAITIITIITKIVFCLACCTWLYYEWLFKMWICWRCESERSFILLFKLLFTFFDDVCLFLSNKSENQWRNLANNRYVACYDEKK